MYVIHGNSGQGLVYTRWKKLTSGRLIHHHTKSDYHLNWLYRTGVSPLLESIGEIDYDQGVPKFPPFA